MKNCVIIEIKEQSAGKVYFAREDLIHGDRGCAKLFTEAEAVRELARLQKWPGSRFQVVVLRLGEEVDYDDSAYI